MGIFRWLNSSAPELRLRRALLIGLPGTFGGLLALGLGSWWEGTFDLGRLLLMAVLVYLLSVALVFLVLGKVGRRG